MLVPRFRHTHKSTWLPNNLTQMMAGAVTSLFATGIAYRLSAKAGTHEHASGHVTYKSGSAHERQKATIEHVFGSSADSPGWQKTEAPWHLGWQMNERNLVWTNDLKLRLLQRHIAQELGIAQHEAQQRIMDITSLLPGLAPRLAAIKASTVVLLCADIEARLLVCCLSLHVLEHHLSKQGGLHACRRSRPGSSS